MDIAGKDIVVSYGEKNALNKANIKVNTGEIVTIIGPNGSGKSTLVKAISRCIKLQSGSVELNGKDISTMYSKEIAKKMAILPQVKTASSDITVETLVSYGRYPHLKFGKRLSRKDKDIIQWAMENTGLVELKDRDVVTLSGGERQRAWVAMALAQKPDILILDEPTTYLDISYQMEVLELVKELNNSLGITVIMVLHDLNQAARYSDRIYVLRKGEVYKEGSPKSIIDSQMLKDIFRIDAEIYEDKVNNCPYFIPNKIVLEVKR